MGAWIKTCASAFNCNLDILYLSLSSPYSVLVWCLQHALSHSINVCAMLELQYVLSSQHCLHPLAIFPMNSCYHLIFICCWNAVLYCWGIVSSFNNSDIVISIIDPSGFPFQSSAICVSPLLSVSLIPTSNRCSRWFGASISLICCSNIWSRSVWTSILLEHRRMCGIISSSLSSHSEYALLVFSHRIYLLSPLCTIVGCTVSKDVPSW